MSKKKNKKAQQTNSNANKPDEIGYFIERSPYYITDSYVSHNGRHCSILKLYVMIGTNRQMSFTDVLDFIPINTLEGVEMHFLTYDQLIKYDTKTRLIKNNAGDSIKSINENEKEKKNKEDDDESARKMRQSEIDDYLDYQSMMQHPEPVVVYDIRLEVVSDSREKIDEQIEILNLKLDKKHSGATWDSIGGEQGELFTKLFDRLDIDQTNNTSTGNQYAGLNFSVSTGVFDDKGIPIGTDALSLVSSTSVFDFDNSLSKQAIVSIPRSSVMARYYKDHSNLQVSASSLVLQSAANQMLMNGKRSHHIVLNDFDYTESGLYYRPKETNQLFKHYDVSKLTINPLQGFGTYDDIVNIYNRLNRKIVNIFSLLMDLEMTQGDKAAVLDVTNSFYVKQQYWVPEADMFPERTHIVNIGQPETYATLGRYIDSFTSLLTRLFKEGTLEIKADRIDSLQSILRQALSAYRSVLDRTTSIESSDAPQIYYDFKTIEEPRLRQIQFINIIDYIIYTAKPGETIFIHGANLLYEETLNMAKETIQNAQNQGIRFVFGFDTVQSPKSKYNNPIEDFADMFTMNGVYYNNLSTEVDWSMTGKCLPQEVEAFSTATVTNLGTTVSTRMQSNAGCQVLLHRDLTKTNNFIHLNFRV